MVKNRLYNLVITIILVMCVSSCQKKNDYANVIPADANAIAAIHLQTIASKAGLNDNENKAALQKLTDALKSGMSTNSFEQLKKILKDSRQSGIDMSAPLYAFKAESFPYPTLVAKVNSQKKVAELFKTLEKEKICTALNETNGVQYTEIGEQMLFAFNGSVLLCISRDIIDSKEEIKEKVAKLLKQTEKSSIVSTSVFKEMQKNKGEVVMLLSPSSMLGEYAQQLNFGLPQDIDITGLWLIGNLSFEKGKIVMSYKNYTENENLKKLFKKQENSLMPTKSTYLNLFPKSTLAILNVGINGETIYNLLQENKEFRANISTTDDADLKALLSSLQNDLTIGVINASMEDVPTFLAYGNIKNRKAIDLLYNSKGDKATRNIIKLNQDQYLFQSESIRFFYSIKGDKICITNKESELKNLGESFNPSVNDFDFSTEMKGKDIAFVVNTEAILALPALKTLVQYGGPEYAAYYTLAQKTEYLELFSNKEKTDIILQLKDKNENALKQIVDFIKTFAGL